MYSTSQRYQSAYSASCSGVATGLDREKFAKNREKEGENQEKEGKNQEKEKKSGRFFYFAPPDR